MTEYPWATKATLDRNYPAWQQVYRQAVYSSVKQAERAAAGMVKRYPFYETRIVPMYGNRYQVQYRKRGHREESL